MPNNRILLLSPYDAKSHRYWHRQLTAGLPQFQWQVLTLKDRHFAWRMGGNAISLQQQYPNQLKANYAVILATSMTDLSTLLGLYPHLNQAKKLLYFHENQFAYPINHKQQGLAEIQMRSIYAALAADCLLFNSNHNRDSFMQGVDALMKKMPDATPKNLAQSLNDRASILPVPIKTDVLMCRHTNESKEFLEVVWNHRWEHDKGPETLLELLRLCQNQPNIKFHILGQQFKQTPPAMQQILTQHTDQCLSIGYVENRADYLHTLQQTDIVLSTAHHDFQGIAMLEAIASGCTPIAPHRLVYPEYCPVENLYPSSNPEQEALSILKLLQNWQQLKAASPRFRWHQLKAAYAEVLSTE